VQLVVRTALARRQVAHEALLEDVLADEGVAVVDHDAKLGLQPGASSRQLIPGSRSRPTSGHTHVMKDVKLLQMGRKAMDITDMVFDLYEDLPWQRVAELKSRSTRAAGQEMIHTRAGTMEVG